jgi:hypothetical protein
VNRFTCEEAFRRLDGYLDRELAAEELRLIEEHQADSASSLQEYSYERSVLEGITGKLRRLTMPEDLLARIQRRLGNAEPGPE